MGQIAELSKEKESVLRGKVCWLLGPDNLLRVKIYQFVWHPYALLLWHAMSCHAHFYFKTVTL